MSWSYRNYEYKYTIDGSGDNHKLRSSVLLYGNYLEVPSLGADGVLLAV